jgi:hypothetical protein
VIEHVVLAGIIREDHVASRPSPAIAVCRDGQITAWRECVERDAVLVQEWAKRRERAPDADAVSAQRAIAAGGRRREEIVVTIVIEEIATLIVIVDGNLLLGCRV